jgi:F-type H+-transporting ATPase subunit b
MSLVRERSLPAAFLAAALALHAAPASASGGLELMPDAKFTLPVLIVLFFVLVPVLKNLLFEPLLQTLDAREARIDGARKEADRISRDAESTLAAYEQRIRGAREESERGRKSVLDDARRAHAQAVARERGDAEQTIERARAEIRAGLDRARVQLRGDAAALARDAAERILGRAL